MLRHRAGGFLGLLAVLVLAHAAGAAKVTLDPGSDSSDLVVRADDGVAGPSEDHLTPVGLPYSTSQEIVVGASGAEGDPRFTNDGLRVYVSQDVGPTVGAMAETTGEIFFSVSELVEYGLGGHYDLAGSLDEALLSLQLYDATDDVVLYESLQHGLAVNFSTYQTGGSQGDFENVLIGSSSGTLPAGHVYRLRYRALKRRLTAGAQAQAQSGELHISLTQVVDNGLAPPGPANVVDEETGKVWVSNQGCGIDVFSTCPSTIPTEVAVRDGASSHYLPGGLSHGLRVTGTSVLRVQGGALDAGGYAYDEARILISGGSHTVDRFLAYDDASVVVRGGSCKLQAQENGQLWIEGGEVASLYTFGDARATVSGGDLTGATLYVSGTFGSSTGSILEVHGTGFTVDGMPVPYGPVTAASGQLAGSLPRGGSIDASFTRNSPAEIVLVEAPPVPALGLLGRGALLGLLALVGCRGCPRARV